MSVLFCKFFHDEDGGAKIDWIVLTTSLVILGLSVGYALSNGADNVATETNMSRSSVEASNIYG
ncbi:MAG: hypothetical protein KUG69_14775 [Marinosulfonomonas sp.]|nr:hypothetical protein [Marinosulfonomonas sp.]